MAIYIIDPATFQQQIMMKLLFQTIAIQIGERNGRKTSVCQLYSHVILRNLKLGILKPLTAIATNFWLLAKCKLVIELQPSRSGRSYQGFLYGLAPT